MPRVTYDDTMAKVQGELLKIDSDRSLSASTHAKKKKEKLALMDKLREEKKVKQAATPTATISSTTLLLRAYRPTGLRAYGPTGPILQIDGRVTRFPFHVSERLYANNLTGRCCCGTCVRVCEQAQKKVMDATIARLKTEAPQWIVRNSGGGSAAGVEQGEGLIRFVQCCIFPRVLFSQLDAVYCARFVHKVRRYHTPPPFRAPTSDF
eukprot:COSAG05_NODE_177_length_14916_cov_8.104002_7_plen_208_part_00